MVASTASGNAQYIEALKTSLRISSTSILENIGLIFRTPTKLKTLANDLLGKLALIYTKW